MSGLLLSLVVLFGLAVPGTPAAGQPANCADLRVYFAQADEYVAERLADLFSNEDWVRSYGRSARKASKTDLGVSVLDEQEMQPFIDLVSIPGEVLLNIPDSEVPAAAQQLHDSALNYYLSLPAMLRAVSTSGLVAAFTFSESLEEAEADNLAAQRTVRKECSSVVAGFEASAESSVWDELRDEIVDTGTVEPNTLRELTPQDFQGVSFLMLFFADEEGTPQSGLPAGARAPRNEEDANAPRSPAQPTQPATHDIYAGIDFAPPPVTETTVTPGADVSDQPYTGARLGDPDAPVTMVIYNDYQCLYCRLFALDTQPKIVEDFVREGEIVLEFREMPILGGPDLANDGNESAQAAEAALCAAEQGMYVEYQTALFTNQQAENRGAFSNPQLEKYAGQLGMDAGAFSTCLESGRYEAVIAQSKAEGQAQGITAVPMFLINGGAVQMTDQGYDLLKMQIEAAIDAASP